MNYKKKYPSDLSLSEWKIVKDLIPVYKRGRIRKTNIMKVINALFYMSKTGCQWDSIPKEYPNRSIIWYYFNKWTNDGTWRNINKIITRRIRVMQGRNPDPSAGILDSQSVKATEMADEVGFDGNKKVKGRKRQILVDVSGFLLYVKNHPANLHDSEGARLMFKEIPKNDISLMRIWADGCYRGSFQRWIKRNHKITLEIVKSFKYGGRIPRKYRSNICDKYQLELFCQKEMSTIQKIDRVMELRRFKIVKWRWIVERTFAWLIKNRRLVKDYEKRTISGESFCYLGMIRLMLKRLDKVM